MVKEIVAYQASNGVTFDNKSDAIACDLVMTLVATGFINEGSASKLIQKIREDELLADDIFYPLEELLKLKGEADD